MNGLDATREILTSIREYKHSTQYEVSQERARHKGIEWHSADEIIVVALTANNTEAEKARCIEAGMTHFMSKPPNMEQLKATIKSVFGINQSQKPQ